MLVNRIMSTAVCQRLCVLIPRAKQARTQWMRTAIPAHSMASVSAARMVAARAWLRNSTGLGSESAVRRDPSLLRQQRVDQHSQVQTFAKSGVRPANSRGANVQRSAEPRHPRMYIKSRKSTAQKRSRMSRLSMREASSLQNAFGAMLIMGLLGALAPVLRRLPNRAASRVDKTMRFLCRRALYGTRECISLSAA
jgi:hypothetical protein